MFSFQPSTLSKKKYGEVKHVNYASKNGLWKVDGGNFKKKIFILGEGRRKRKRIKERRQLNTGKEIRGRRRIASFFFERGCQNFRWEGDLRDGPKSRRVSRSLLGVGDATGNVPTVGIGR